MTKILKRPLSIILAVLMVMSLFVAVPMTASATEYNAADSLKLKASDLAVGDVILTDSPWGTSIAHEDYEFIMKGGTYSVGSVDNLQTDDVVAPELDSTPIGFYYMDTDVAMWFQDTSWNNTYYFPLDAEGHLSNKWHVLAADHENKTITFGGHIPGYIAEEDYLTFTSLEDESSVRMSFQSGSGLQYNKNNTGWQDYEEYYRIWLNKGEYVRLRGSNTVSYYNGGSFSIRGKVAASGNIMSLRLNSDSTSQGLDRECFHQMFAEDCDGLITAPELPETTLAKDCYEGMFNRCRNLTTAPALPATTLAHGCYSEMFQDCSSLTAAPALPATSLAYGCYHDMFSGCTSLTELPELPATSLAEACYYGMFDGCSNIRISDQPGTYDGIKYSEAYRIPTADTATNAYEALNFMFASTGGKFKGTPSLNTTYYIGKPVYTVTWKNGDTTLETDADVESGAAPSYGGATPTKASDTYYDYTFSGWSDGTNTYGLSDTLPNVTADVTYTAQFSETAHAYTLNPTFNWTQDASTGDWDCDTLTLSCSCGATQDTNVAGVLGATNVKCTANANGDFTYKISKKISGVTYEDTKTLDANGVVKSVTQLKAAAAKGGSWELGNDIDRVINVKCANGFVLDGKNYTVTRPDGNSNYPVFVAADKNAGFTLKNLTIDGVANTINGRPAIASAQSNGNSGNVINLDNVTITNWDFDASNNGAILAFGSATVNMTNCNIDTDSDYDVWGGAASTINVDGGEVGTVYLNGGTATAELTNGADVDNIVAFVGNTITTDDTSNITLPANSALQDNGDGSYTIVHVHSYTLNPTFNWTQDASTGDWTCDTLTLSCPCGDSQDYPVTGFFGASAVTVTANTDGSFTYSVSKKVDGVTYSDTKTLEANGVVKSATQLKAAAKKGGSWELGNDIDQAVGISCADGFELDGNNYTVTRHTNVATNPVFVAANKNASFTLENLTIDGIADQTEVRPAIASAQSGVNTGNVINLNNVTITNWDFDADNNGAVLAWGYATVNMDNCNIDTDSTYDVWVGSKGTVDIAGGDTGNVYLHSYSGTGAVLNAAGGANIDKITLDTTVTSTLKADIGRATVGAIEANGDIPSEVVVIDPSVSSVNAPDGYEWAFSEEEGRKTLAPIDPENPLQGKAQIIGYQNKAVQADAEGNGVRILTKIDRDWLEANATEYGYVVAKVQGKDMTANFSNMKKDGGNGEKTIDCTGTYNNGIDGIDNTYVTLAVNGMSDTDQVAARFYVVVNGVTYYANYINTISYDGIIATYTA